ncbi:hypothetical protein GCK32_021171, partial [Trichostrongylus colubriformis]
VSRMGSTGTELTETFGVICIMLWARKIRGYNLLFWFEEENAVFHMQSHNSMLPNLDSNDLCVLLVGS